MPNRRIMERAKRDKRQGKSASTQAGEFVREEMHHVRNGRHGARSPKQAIAIGLSKARRAGVRLGAPKEATAETRRKAARDTAAGKQPLKSVSRTRSRAVTGALKREQRGAASKSQLARQARSAAKRRTAAQRSAAAHTGAMTKGRAARSAAATKAARTRTKRRG
jgi:hypothetical protein